MILAGKFKNAVRKNFGTEVTASLKNIRINGSARGCSGFFVNPENKACVYVNTEASSYPALSLLYRYADDTKDFKGYRNRYATDFNDLVQEISEMLKTPVEMVRDIRI